MKFMMKNKKRDNMKNTIATNDLITGDEKVEVKFTSTYRFPLSWLTNEDGLIEVNNEKNFNQLINTYFRSQFFNDAFGSVPAQSFTLDEIQGHDGVIKEIDNRIKSLNERNENK